MAISTSGGSPLEISNKGWVSITKNYGSGQRCRSPCKIYWNVDSSAVPSPDRVSIPAPNQQNMTNSEGELAEEMDDCRDRDQDDTLADNNEKAGGSASIKWLRTHIVVCGKAVGVFVGNNDRDLEPIIKFAQAHEDQNYAVRTEGRSKKKVPREPNGV